MAYWILIKSWLDCLVFLAVFGSVLVKNLIYLALFSLVFVAKSQAADVKLVVTEAVPHFVVEAHSFQFEKGQKKLKKNKEIKKECEAAYDKKLAELEALDIPVIHTKKCSYVANALGLLGVAVYRAYIAIYNSAEMKEAELAERILQIETLHNPKNNEALQHLEEVMKKAL